MLNKANFLVVDFASKEESRYNCQAIQVTPKATVATNGHYLAWVSTAKMEPSSFPVVEGFEGAQGDFKPFLLDTKSAQDIRKALPKKTAIPSLAFAAVHVSQNGDGGDHPALCVTDLERPQMFRPKVPKGTFPNIDQVMPKIEDAMFSICVDADYLAQIAKAYAQFIPDNGDCKALTIRFYKPDERKDMRGEKQEYDRPIRFDATNNEQGMTVVLMPLRSETNDPFGTYGEEERRAARDAQKAVEDAKKAEEDRLEANAELASEEHREE